jgi:hypothetical protein
VAGVSLVVSLLIALTGGVAVTLGGVLMRAQRPGTALAIGVVCALAAWVTGGASAVRDSLADAWRGRHRAAAPIATAAAVLTVLLGVAWNTWTASGADASGYVSQARMLADGQLWLMPPLAADVPWPTPGWVASPLGWRPGPISGAIVPTYAPGLPLVMAIALTTAGETAAFVCVPFAGAAAVWLTYRLGLRFTQPLPAAAAALLTALAPVLLFQVVQPMSDVPVTAWWLAALVGLLGRRPLASGACTSMAILTRPNLAPVAVFLALAWLWIGSDAADATGDPRRRAWRAGFPGLFRFTLAALPGVVLWFTLNHVWYGHVLASGYGAFRDLFAWTHVAPNLARYAMWSVDTHTWFIALALTSPVVWWRARAPGASAAAGRADAGAAAGSVAPATARAAVLAGGFALLVVLAYLPYVPFDEWTYLRFLLPALPVALLFACDTAERVLSRMPASAAGVLLVFGVAALAGTQVQAARKGQAFNLQRLEQRYAMAGHWAGRHLPAQAAVFAVQHSGSLRYYGNRPALRWDQLDPAWFDRAVAALQARGFVPYLLVEDWEEPSFRDRVGAWSACGRLDGPPAFELAAAATIRFYDLRGCAATPPLPVAPRTPSTPGE